MRLFPAQPLPNRIQISARSYESHTSLLSHGFLAYCLCDMQPEYRKRTRPSNSPGTFRLPPTSCTSCRPGRDRRVPGPSKDANRRVRRQSNRGGGHGPTGQGYALRAANDPQKPRIRRSGDFDPGAGHRRHHGHFSFVDAVLRKPLPFPGADQILNVWEKPPGGERNGISTLNFLDWKNQNTVFTAMAAQSWGSVTLIDADVPVELRNGRASAPYFEILGVKPMLGRTFAADEDQLGKNQVVILSHRVWQNRFGEDSNIIGRSIRLNGEPYTVIGVMPPGMYDREWQDVWTPLAFKPSQMTRDYHWMISWARLKPGVTLQQAREQMKGIAARIEQAYPKSNKGWSVTVDRYEDRMVGQDLRQSLLVLLAAVGAVLLIGCVNLANLLLVRGAGREREVAVRSALGAGRARLVRQFLTESVLLAGIGGAVGVALGWALMLGLKAWIPPLLLPAEADVSLNSQVLLFAVAIVVTAGILFGIAPALQSMKADLVGSLKEGGRGGTTGINRTYVRNGLAVAEIALAFILLSGAALLIRSFYRLQQVAPGV